MTRAFVPETSTPVTYGVAGDHHLSATVDAIGVGELGFDRIVLSRRHEAKVEGQTEAEVDRERQQTDDEQPGEREDPGPKLSGAHGCARPPLDRRPSHRAAGPAHHWPPLQASRAGFTGSVPANV